MDKLREDLKRLYKRAALIGAIVALLCHVVPPQYRAPCDALARICTLASKGTTP